MSELDKLFDTVMKDKAELINNETSDSERDEFNEALREKKKADII